MSADSDGGQGFPRPQRGGSMEATASTSARAQALAARFALAHDEILALLQSCSAAAWQTPCTAQGWSVAATAGEIAHSYRLGGAVLQAVVAGRCPLVDLRALLNPAHRGVALDVAGSPAATLAQLRHHGARVACLIRQLTDEHLDRTLPSPVPEDTPVRTHQLIELLLIGKGLGLLAVIRAAVQRAS